MEPLDRITQQAGVMGGKACVRGMRVTVGMIVGQIGADHSVEDILSDYPMQALRLLRARGHHAAWRAEEREVVLANT